MPEYAGRKMNFNLAQKLDLIGKLPGAARFALLAVPVAFGLVLTAQSQIGDTAADSKHLKFAVVSIRQNKAGGPQLFGTATPDGYRMHNMFLAAPIFTAYVPQTGGAWQKLNLKRGRCIRGNAASVRLCDDEVRGVRTADLHKRRTT